MPRPDVVSSNGHLTPSELAPIAGGQLALQPAAAWNAMNVEARARGLELLPNGRMSSYRTYGQQVMLWRLYESGQGNLAAVPGSSNHGFGMAVDLATPQMRTMVDRIGRRYGWAKEWSDAPSEWWHIKYQVGIWSGPDPGPYGQPPQAPEDSVAIQAVVKQNGAIELFVEKSDGSIWHTWQTAPNSGWWGAETGKRTAGWQNMGTPGK
jgi:hypothetical protein